MLVSSDWAPWLHLSMSFPVGTMFNLTFKMFKNIKEFLSCLLNRFNPLG